MELSPGSKSFKYAVSSLVILHREVKMQQDKAFANLTKFHPIVWLCGNEDVFDLILFNILTKVQFLVSCSPVENVLD